MSYWQVQLANYEELWEQKMDSLFDSPEKVAPCQSQSENINGIPIFLLKMQKKGLQNFRNVLVIKHSI